MRQETTADFLPIHMGLKEVLSRVRHLTPVLLHGDMCQHRATTFTAVVLAEDRRQAEQERTAKDCQEKHIGKRCSSWVGCTSAIDVLCTLT